MSTTSAAEFSKTWRRVLIVIVVVLSYVPGLSGQKPLRLQSPVEFVWPRNARDALMANTRPRAQIEQFVRSLKKDFFSLEKTVTGEFRFAKLEPEKFYLVVSLADKDRPIHWSLGVIYPDGAAYRYINLPAAARWPLAWLVTDLNGDGYAELISAELVAGYRGADTNPVYWYSIYRVRDGSPQDVSAVFPDFYRNVVLAQISFPGRLLQELSETSPDSARVGLAEVEFVRLRYQRKIAGEREAGLREALVWAKSEDSTLVYLGIQSLEEISTPSARETLRELEKSGNRFVSQLAKRALERVERTLPPGP